MNWPTPEQVDQLKVIAATVTATATVLKYTGKLKDWTGQKISHWIGEEIDARFAGHRNSIEEIVDAKIHSLISSEEFANTIRRILRSSMIRPNGSL